MWPSSATSLRSLPDRMKEWVERQVAGGRYANASDYIRDLIRRDQEMSESLQGLIDEARASGVSDVDSDELFERIRRKTRAKLTADGRDAA